MQLLRIQARQELDERLVVTKVRNVVIVDLDIRSVIVLALVKRVLCQLLLGIELGPFFTFLESRCTGLLFTATVAATATDSTWTTADLLPFVGACTSRGFAFQSLQHKQSIVVSVSISRSML
jgi:hypothetical protein